MYANASLIDRFDELVAPLATCGVDLPTSIERLEDSIRSSVGSLLGWSLSVRVDGALVTMTSMPSGSAAADVRASLRIPLSAFSTGGLDGGIVFCASQPHAFRRFAANFVPLLGPIRCLLRTDQDLNPSFTGGLSGAHLMATINRAIGVLVSRGDTADSARVRLQDSARAGHQTMTQSARVLLAEGLRPTLSTAGRRFGIA